MRNVSDIARPNNAFGSPSRALLGEIVSYRPDGSARALPEGSALGGLLDCQADVEASMVASEEQATPAHRHCVPHEPATTFIRGLQPVLQGPVT